MQTFKIGDKIRFTGTTYKNRFRNKIHLEEAQILEIVPGRGCNNKMDHEKAIITLGMTAFLIMEAQVGLLMSKSLF